LFIVLELLVSEKVITTFLNDPRGAASHLFKILSKSGSLTDGLICGITNIPPLHLASLIIANFIFMFFDKVIFFVLVKFALFGDFYQYGALLELYVNIIKEDV